MQRGLLVKFSCNSPTLYLIAYWRALLVVRSFVLEWRVVVTTQSMILKDIKIFSQNIWKSSLMVNTILKVKTDFNIIFIQKPSWSTVYSIPSSINSEGKLLVGVVNHLNWLTFIRNLETMNNLSRVTIYSNIRLSFLHFSFCRDIINFKNIFLVSFLNNNNIF